MVGPVVSSINSKKGGCVVGNLWTTPLTTHIFACLEIMCL